MSERKRRGVAAATCVLIGVLASGCADVVVFGRKVHDANALPKEAPSAAPPAASIATSSDGGGAGPTVGRRNGLAVAAVQVDATSAGVDDAALVDAVRRALRARTLLATQPAAPSASIAIVELEAQPTSNAVVLGSRPGAGRLVGQVRILEASGAEIRAFDIVASSVLRAPAATPAAFTLKPLYEDFATRLAEQLEGASR